MELKWIVIGLVGWAVIMMGGLALEQHSKSQCRIEAIKALVKPELIADICK